MAAKHDLAEYDAVLTAGSAPKAIKASGAEKATMLMVPIGELHIADHFNIRVPTPTYEAALAELVASMVENGFMADKPLTGFATASATEGEPDYITVVDGHRRLAAALEAIKQGAPIERLPVVLRTGSMEDLIAGLYTSNTGVPPTVLETSFVANRLAKFDMDNAAIAKKMTVTPAFVDFLLTLARSHPKIRTAVALDKISATEAVNLVRTKKGGAVEVLAEMIAKAEARGKTKATAKDRDDSDKPAKAKKEKAEATPVGVEETLDPTINSIFDKETRWDLEPGQIVDAKSIEPVARFGKGTWFKNLLDDQVEILNHVSIVVMTKVWDVIEPVATPAPAVKPKKGKKAEAAAPVEAAADEPL